MSFSFTSTPPTLDQQNKQAKGLWQNMRHFLQKDLNICLEHGHFLLAISGGADSLALLCLWQWLSDFKNISFSVLHINHGLRAESKAEAISMKNLCESWKIPCFIEELDVISLSREQKKGYEEMARQVRYELFEKYRIACNANWVCLGHHMQDLQEDIVMRMLRGAGWPALGGMVAKDEHRHILRPLLLSNPLHLRLLLKNSGLSWAEDASNTDLNYLRNRVRHTIIPLLQAENPNLEQKTEELWYMAKYDAMFWQQYLTKLCSQYNVHLHEQRVMLPSTLLQSIDKATRLRLYIYTIKLLQSALNKASGQSRAKTLFLLDEAFIQGRGNTFFQLSGKIQASLKNNCITFEFS